MAQQSYKYIQLDYGGSGDVFKFPVCCRKQSHLEMTQDAEGGRVAGTQRGVTHPTDSSRTDSAAETWER